MSGFPLWPPSPGRRELMLLTGVLALALAVWLFAALANEVMEGDTRGFDTALLLALRQPGQPDLPWGPGWFQEMQRDFSALGSVGVLALVTGAVAGFLLLTGRRAAMLLLLASVLGGTVLALSLKAGFDRPRPDLVPHGSVVTSASFPSSHSMMAAIVYLTLGALLARVQPRRRLKLYLLLLAAAVTVLVGISRVYLGVHWPTDVLAGWTVGAAWALLCWLVARALQRRGQVEPDTAPLPPDPPRDSGTMAARR